MNQKLGGAALVRNCSFTFCQPGPGPSVRAETPCPAPCREQGFIAACPLGLPCSTFWPRFALSLSFPFPPLSLAPAFSQAPPAGKGQEYLLRLAWQSGAGSSMETRTHSTHPFTCCVTYPAAKTCSHRCLSANTLAFLNTFQSHPKETNHERKDVSSLECIMSP